MSKTKTTLLEDFKKVHGDFYNYDKVIYTGIVGKKKCLIILKYVKL